MVMAVCKSETSEGVAPQFCTLAMFALAASRMVWQRSSTISFRYAFSFCWVKFTFALRVLFFFESA